MRLDLSSLRYWCLIGFAVMVFVLSGVGQSGTAMASSQRVIPPNTVLGIAEISPPVEISKAPAAPTESETSAAETPAQLFELHCAGCHVNGGNIIRRGKNLKARAMARNGVDSPAAVAAIITNGKGLMSAYGDRFTPAEIEALATYVWKRSQDNWR